MLTCTAKGLNREYKWRSPVQTNPYKLWLYLWVRVQRFKLLSLSTALQQNVVCNNLRNLQSGQEVTVCHHQKELQFILCLFWIQTSCWILLSSASMFSSSCLQSSICSLFSSLAGRMWSAERQAGGLVNVHYFSAIFWYIIILKMIQTNINFNHCYEGTNLKCWVANSKQVGSLLVL